MILNLHRVISFTSGFEYKAPKVEDGNEISESFSQRRSPTLLWICSRSKQKSETNNPRPSSFTIIHPVKTIGRFKLGLCKIIMFVVNFSWVRGYLSSLILCLLADQSLKNIFDILNLFAEFRYLGLCECLFCVYAFWV